MSPNYSGSGLLNCDKAFLCWFNDDLVYDYETKSNLGNLYVDILFAEFIIEGIESND